MLKYGLASLFIVTGLLHLVKPDLYRPAMPPWLPAHDLLILVSGLAEIVGGAGLLAHRTRRAAAIGLILLLAAVFPANVQMLLAYQADGGPWWEGALLWLRLPVQGLLMWLAWRARGEGRGTSPHPQPPASSP